MKRRQTFATLIALSLHSRLALAQKRNVRIGALGPRQNSIVLAPVMRRLAELGYREGSNLTLLFRSADGVTERFPALARELIDAKCDLIFAVGAEAAARALVDARSPIPIVLLAADYDPVKAGFVTNLRRPGGLVTGISSVAIELAAKRVEVLRAILPKANRILVFSDRFTEQQLEATIRAASVLKIETVVEKFSASPYDFEAALVRGRDARVNALVLLSSPNILDQRRQLLELASRHKLPVASGSSSYGDEGVLFYYSPDLKKGWARAADIAAIILGGAVPGNIPLELPTHFELAINLRTAKALGITVPQAVLLRADRVIE
ncbi:MAG: ABC transporter substrate-binding protein [Burkholderiales bacterium]